MASESTPDEQSQRRSTYPLSQGVLFFSFGLLLLGVQEESVEIFGRGLPSYSVWFYRFLAVVVFSISLLFMVAVFRHRATHQGPNIFNFCILVGGGTPGQTSKLHLDPRDTGLQRGTSKRPMTDELTEFWQLVSGKCEQILSLP